MGRGFRLSPHSAKKLEVDIVKRILPFALLLSLAAQSQAAPLFPDVKDTHWAKDAVAALAAKGLVEGYPDGTFKGDRVATRWEVAMVVARFLAKMEQQHATFATKAELDELRKLVDALRPELDALGVRVANLEEGASKLDQRVTELERITFYGSFDAKVITQTLHNTGQVDNDNQRRGAGIGPVPYLNYNNLVGSPAGFQTLRPSNQGVLPVTDTTGRPLVNGASFTSKATLGLKIKVSPDVDAGAEFAAYTSQGNTYLGSYYGIPQPYLSNPTGQLQIANGAITGMSNTPFTKMMLDNFWVVHKPSQTKLIVGAYDKTNLDPLVYVGQANLNLFGPKRLNYGFDATGTVDLGTHQRLVWEALGSRFGDATVFLGDAYQHYAIGADLAYQFGKPLAFNGGQLSHNIAPGKTGDLAGEIKLNFARIWEEDSGLFPGQTPVGLGGTGRNVAFGASTGYTSSQWVNPPGYYLNQMSSFERLRVGTLPNTVDTRPVPGWSGSVDSAVGMAAGGGNVGPQDQTTLGLTGHYDFSLNDESFLRVAGQGAHSEFKPNRNSEYSVGGNALRFELSSTLLKGDLDLALYYLSIDSTYSPYYTLSNQLGFRVIRTWNYNYSYLYEYNIYPQNREGPQFRGRFSFDDKHGEVTLFGSLLKQKDTSLYDVRVVGGSLGTGIPTNNVIGFSPGYTDMVFAGFAHPGQYGARSASSFTDTLQPMENPRGEHSQFYVAGWYKWDEPNLKVNWNLEHTGFWRPSSLSPGMGGSQNQIDLDINYAVLGLTWKANDTLSVRGGSEFQLARGHYDPLGNYNGYAVKNNSISFRNIDTLQTIPYLGFDVALGKDTTWSTDLRYYIATDRIGSNVFAGTGEGARGFTQHPFSWEGIQVSTEYHIKF